MKTRAARLTRIARTWFGSTLMLAAMVAVSGCSKAPVELVGDEGDAQSILTAVLDAWQAGQEPADLREEDPAMRVADEDWQAGKALKGYQVSGAPMPFGGHWRVSATLTLTDDQKSEQQKLVAYAVTMEPAITVLRADDVPE